MLAVTQAVRAMADAAGLSVGSSVTLGVRPEHLNVVSAGSGRMQVTADVSERLGSDTFCHVVTASGEALTMRYPRAPKPALDRVDIFIAVSLVRRGDHRIHKVKCLDETDGFLGSEPRLTLFHGHSFTANPLGCAAAVASLPADEQKAAALAGRDELKLAAKRVRELNKRKPRDEAPSDEKPAAETAAGAEGHADELHSLRSRVAELTAENAELRRQVAQLQAALPEGGAPF